MNIVFDDLDELKEFVCSANLSYFTKNQEPWGGVGISIDNIKSVSENDSYYETPRGGDFHIYTKYWKELSWLLCQLMQISRDRNWDYTWLEMFKISIKGFYASNSTDYFTSDELLYAVINMFKIYDRGIQITRNEKEFPKNQN